MGTRNLTMVIQNNKTKVAQYGQWDGDPGSAGVSILNFLNKKDLNIFVDKLKNVQLKELSQLEDIQNDIAKKKEKNSDYVWQDEYPELSRDAGCDILDLIYNNDKSLILKDSESFAADSLFCKWAYVIDLDKKTFEVYKGFNEISLTQEDRFFNLEKNASNGYHPVKKIIEFSLNDLPNEDDFLNQVFSLLDDE